MSTRKSFNVENGPSLDRLLDAFKYAYTEVSIPLSFTVAAGYSMPPDHPGSAILPLQMEDVRIVSLEHESGDDHSLNVRGNCLVALGEWTNSSRWDPVEKINVGKVFRKLIRANFTMYYDAKTRKGHIEYSI